MDRAIFAGIIAAVIAAIVYWELSNGGDSDE